MKAINYKYLYASIILILCALVIIKYNNKPDKELNKDKVNNSYSSQRNPDVGENSLPARSQAMTRVANDTSITSTQLVFVGVDLDDDTDLIDTPLIRSRKFKTASGRQVELQLVDNSEVLSVIPNKAENHFLVAHGSKREFSIYDIDGNFLTALPTVDLALPHLNPRTPFDWRWIDNNTLIATLGFIHKVLPNQYPERPTELYDMRFYLFDLELEQLNELKLPRALHGNGMLRLDGVTINGLLKLSLIPNGADYSVVDDSHVLGYFKTQE